VLEDELEEKRMRVRTLRQLCVPAATDGREVSDPGAALACYAVQQLPGQPAFRPPGTLLATSELASQSLIVRNAQRRLCLPTEVVETR
jgi:hypothetical protein